MISDRGQKPGSKALETMTVILLMVIGLAMCWMSYSLVTGLITRWKSISWGEVVFAISVVCLLIPLGTCMALYPFRNVRLVLKVMEIILWPTAVSELLAYVYAFVMAPVITFCLVTATPLLVITTMSRAGAIPELPRKGLLYCALVVASLVFTYWGGRLTAVIMGDRHGGYARLFVLLQPKLIRLYIYAMMAISYFVACLERFFSATLIPGQWWLIYKDVLVEVLVTYVAADAAMEVWRSTRKDA